MKFKGIDFPRPLIEAHRRGELVVFAGAGVSIPHPSGLPLFSDLTKQIAKNTKFENNVKEPFDRALGDMEREGTKVHLLAHGILSEPASQPTELHSLLLQISKFCGSQFRLVTTNMDPHFTTAAKQLNPSVEEYYAPALPVGSSFDGVVYLHGSVLKPCDRFVLTDRDFGRAYLTQGWATTFIKEMFQNFVVLFVGYSANDTVMNYLARGLPPADSRRFALAHDANDERWRRLGITSIEYPVTNEGRDHGALTEGIRAWYQDASRGMLGHETKIQSIVSGPPPIGQEEIDYILDRINNSDCIQFFTRHARRPDWIPWLKEQGILNALFDPTATLSTSQKHLAHWLSGTFITKHPYELLQLVESSGQNLHPEFWSSSVFALRRDKETTMDRRAFRMWVWLLLKRTYPMPGIDSLEFLLEECKLPEDKEVAIALLAHLTRPQLKLQRRLYVLSEETEVAAKSLDANVELVAHSHWLSEFWAKIFKDQLDTVGERLLNLFNGHIHLAYDLLEPFSSNPDKFDSLSFQREAIERHSANSTFSESFPLMLDAFSDILIWVSTTREDLLATVLRETNSPKRLLHRSAIFAFGRSSFHTSDQKIDWLLKQELLFDYHAHHEVYDLLRLAYPALSEPVRIQLLNRIGLGETNAEDNDPKWKAYPGYVLFHWLKSADPKCNLVAEKFDSLQKQHPHFRPQEQPDLRSGDTFASWGRDSEVPYQASELLQMDPGESLTELLSWKPTGVFKDDRSGLLAQIELATQTNLGWGISLGNALVSAKQFESDIWYALVNGFGKAVLGADHWKDILEFFRANSGTWQHRDRIADLLKNGVSRKEDAIPQSLMDAAMGLAESLWNSAPSEGAETEISDWLQASISHFSGKLAEFWLHAISRLSEATNTKEIPKRILEQLNLMVNEKAHHGELARVLLASQVLFLFAYDRTWTETQIVPMFDSNTNKKRAQQAWDGYLTWGRWSDDLLESLRTHFTNAFAHLEMFGSDRARFTEFVSNISLGASVSPLERQWLFTFLLKAAVDDRVAYARYLHWQFHRCTADAKTKIWNRWIRDYWNERNAGRPMAWSEREQAEMIVLGAYLEGEDFEACVNLIVASQAPQLGDSYFYHAMDEEGLADKNPKQVLRLLQHLLPQQKRDFSCRYLEPVVKNLIELLRDDSTLHNSLNKTCDELARLGCSEAAAMKSSINLASEGAN